MSERELVNQYRMLVTTLDALYIEIDKFAKKNPKETLSDFGTQRVHKAVSDTKSFLPEDRELESIRIFEPAGDNPEYRDALLVLGQLKAALSRFETEQGPAWFLANL